jgi:hypothetical protein
VRIFQSPKRSGRSRHGVPARYRYSTASTKRRLSRAVAPTSPSLKQVLNPFPLVVAKSIAGHASAFYKADPA